MKSLRKSILTLLALTLFGGAGAWAQGPTQVTEITTDLIASWQNDNSDVTLADMQALGFKAVDASVAQAWTGAPQGEYAVLIYGFDGGYFTYILFDDNGHANLPSHTGYTKRGLYGNVAPNGGGTKHFFTSAPAAIELTKAGANQWSLGQTPDYDLELQVEYYEAHALKNIPAGWTVKVNGVEQPKPYQGDSLMITETDSVTLIPDGNPRRVKSVTLVETPSARALSEATAEDVGKIIGADGNIYDNADAATAAGTDASAIIAYVGTAGSVDESSSTYKGLAIALTHANGGSTCKWCSATGGTCLSQADAVATAVTYKNGITSTNTLTSDGHTHAAATAASSYGTARPSGVSDWFLPSVGQWNLIVQGLATKKAGSTVSTDLTESNNSAYTTDNLNTVITAAGGASLMPIYWSSTERNTSYAWRMRFSSGNTSGGIKNLSNYVRAVFAF